MHYYCEMVVEKREGGREVKCYTTTQHHHSENPLLPYFLQQSLPH